LFLWPVILYVLAAAVSNWKVATDINRRKEVSLYCRELPWSLS